MDIRSQKQELPLACFRSLTGGRFLLFYSSSLSLPFKSLLEEILIRRNEKDSTHPFGGLPPDGGEIVRLVYRDDTEWSPRLGPERGRAFKLSGGCDTRACIWEDSWH